MKTIYFYLFNKQIWTEFSNTFHKWGIASRQRWTVDNALAVNGFTRRCRPKASLETIASPVVVVGQTAEWWVCGRGLRQGRVGRKGKCTAGSLGYQWKGQLWAAAEQLSFICLFLSHHRGKTMSKKKKNMFQGYFRRRAAYVTRTPLSWGKDYSKMYQYIM